MELSQLIYFQKIAELQNITKASAELNVSQPSLSRSLKNLEAELNTPLFERVGKKLVLNQNGILFKEYISHILNTLTEARNKLSQQESLNFAPINIAMIHDNRLLPQLLTAFHNAYPYIKITLHHFSSPYSIPAECSLVLHASEEMLNTFSLQKTTRLLTEECMIGLSVRHPLAQLDTLPLELLAEENFLVLSLDNSYCKFSRNFLKTFGFQPKIIMECDNQLIIDALVSQNVGISLFPTHTWAVPKETIILKQIEQHPLYQPLYISCTTTLPELSTQIFYDFAISFFENYRKGLSRNDMLPSK